MYFIFFYSKSNDYNNEHVYTSRRLPAILPMHVTVESKDGTISEFSLLISYAVMYFASYLHV